MSRLLHPHLTFRCASSFEWKMLRKETKKKKSCDCFHFVCSHGNIVRRKSQYRLRYDFSELARAFPPPFHDSWWSVCMEITQSNLSLFTCFLFCICSYITTLLARPLVQIIQREVVTQKKTKKKRSFIENRKSLDRCCVFVWSRRSCPVRESMCTPERLEQKKNRKINVKVFSLLYDFVLFFPL